MVRGGNGRLVAATIALLERQSQEQNRNDQSQPVRTGAKESDSESKGWSSVGTGEDLSLSNADNFRTIRFSGIRQVRKIVARKMFDDLRPKSTR